MSVLMSSSLTRPATVKDAALVHRLYEKTPDYFRIISIPIPTLYEVEMELEAAAGDERRFTELVLAPELEGAARDEQTGRSVVGYLDYKLDYPEADDATVNLMLIQGSLQNRGFGRACIQDLEARLKGRVGRVLASIYGRNARAEKFWRALGYQFAIDAKPVLDWYAKVLK